ncbi:hypothetical protein TNCV_3504571 [Trichonephila clavipes]|uniref:Uncharacterized protein n=1 Tax=Trichonephila clavipes TaxID=2585209 RepID=A0A8X6S484_TRICX|nr:hypothetical protein TNCV_3504571 [Trichonephila clavipes]
MHVESIKAQTSSGWCGVEVRRMGCLLRCRPRHLTIFKDSRSVAQSPQMIIRFTHLIFLLNTLWLVRPVSIETESLKYNDKGLIRDPVNGENKYFRHVNQYPLKNKTNSSSYIIPAPNIKLKDRFNNE